jgi:drug/metabolite transporter (DMT)-like permease
LEVRVRTGDEPRHARSALRLRMFLAIFGLACAVAGVALFARTGITGWMIAFIVLALVAAFDLGRVLVHLRQGPHYQPGPATPPYPPVESASRPPHSSGPPSPQTRKRWYFLLMGLCLMLFVLAWAWVRLYSPTAAVVMTIVAMTIPPLAAIVANAGSPINRRRR